MRLDIRIRPCVVLAWVIDAARFVGWLLVTASLAGAGVWYGQPAVLRDWLASDRRAGGSLRNGRWRLSWRQPAGSPRLRHGFAARSALSVGSGTATGRAAPASRDGTEAEAPVAGR